MLTLKCNTHIHSPYSYSSSSSVNEIIEKARQQNIKVIGINDFYTTAAFRELSKCQLYKIYPLYNIEIVCYSRTHQEKGIRLNDRKIPGKIYLTAKAIRCPYNSLSRKLVHQIEKRNEAARETIRNINSWLENLNISSLDEETIYRSTKGYISDRHIIKALSEKVKEFDIGVKLLDLMARIDTEVIKEGMIIMEEYMDIKMGMKILNDMDAIISYPLLLDDHYGKMTEFEQDLDLLSDQLTKLGIKCVEIIPHRNSPAIVNIVAEYFDAKDFMVVFGTEHNDGFKSLLVEIPERLEELNFINCCKLVSHQHFGILDEESGRKILSKLV